MRINFIVFDEHKENYDLKDLLGIQLCIIKKDDTSENIVKRVEKCIDNYIIFFDKLCIASEFNREVIKSSINNIKRIIINSINYYLCGDIIKAIHEFEVIWILLKNRVMSKYNLSNKTLFRARTSDNFYLYHRDEMFHIPLNNREKVGNQRYSLSGLPCLYLGATSYICWEELKRPNVFSCNFVGISVKDNIPVLDICLVDGSKEVTLEDLSLIPLFLVCSLPSKIDSLFKPEYIISQLIMHFLISDNVFLGIRYYSSSLTKDNAYPFYTDQNTVTEDLGNHLCYVFPVKEISGQFCEKLKDSFLISNPYNLNTDIISKSEKLHLIPKENNAFIPYYKYSVFRRLDDILTGFIKDNVSREFLTSQEVKLNSNDIFFHMQD